MSLGTTNQAQFKNKPLYKEGNCKPKNRHLDTGIFNGKSEYQG